MRAYALAIVLALAAGASQAATVVNGGFETGDFSGWTLSGQTDHEGVGGTASEGSFAAFFGQVGGTGSIAQNIATGAGQSYRISFDLRNGASGSNSFDVSFGGTSLMSLADSAAFPYTHFSLIGTAPTNLTDLVFTFSQVPNYWYLDAVSVSAVPIPPALPLMVGALASLGFLKCKRAA